jgi:hypothetical protein
MMTQAQELHHQKINDEAGCDTNTIILRNAVRVIKEAHTSGDLIYPNIRIFTDIYNVFEAYNFTNLLHA